MKEMKVIRKRRRRVSRATKKRRRALILCLITLCSVCIVAGIGVLCVGHLANKGADNTEETKAPCVIENGVQTEIEMENGATRILTVSVDEVTFNSLKFSSDNTDVLIVDSGGRVDAKKEGKAVVTAAGDGFSGECVVTVTKAPDKEKPVERTTAIITNTDIVDKNRADKSKALYSITVNRRTNTTTVYTYDDKGAYVVPVRAMVCSCGEFNVDNITPTGEFSVYFKQRWHALYGDVYGQYVTGFSGAYLFHSVPYTSTKANSLENAEFNKIGTNASQGCVRLTVSDAKWVYDNCDIKTVVRVIDEDGSSDPLGTPETIKIGTKAQWDPTDPDPENPYNKRLPQISGAEDITINKGDKYDPLKGISAKDTCGADITDKITVVGNVITAKPGKYYITYMVEDAIKMFNRKTIKVTVEQGNGQ